MTKKTPPKAISDDPVTAWARKVVAGDVVAGPHVRNAARRHLNDLVEGPKRGLSWDLAAACRVLGFFHDALRLNGGQFEGQPFELHPSQAFIVGSLFGWKKPDGTRRYRRAYIEIAKGNGKSPLAAGIGHYCLLADGEARAEVYAAASKKDQAMVLFRDAVAMVDQSPALSRRLRKSGSNPVWNLADLVTGSFFRPISSESGQSGPRPHCALCDEVHEMRDGAVLEMLERGFKWRRQPLLLMITNSGTDPKSVCGQEHDHAVRVAAGTRAPDDDFTFVGEPLDDETFGFVCALDKDDDPLEDPHCWIKANPLLGVTVMPDYLAGVVRQGKQIQGKLNGILRLHFCRWTDSDEGWLSRPALEAVLADFDPAEHEGRRLWLGLDLSGSQDLTALGAVVETGLTRVQRDDGTAVEQPTYDAWVEAWTPADTLSERQLRDGAPYDAWVRQGWLHAERGRTIRLDYVAARVAEYAALYDVQLLAYDRYSYRRFEDELDALGVTIAQAEHPQGGKRRARPSEEQAVEARRQGREPEGLWMPGSVKAFEDLVHEGRIRIRRNPVAVMAIMGAALEHDPFDNRWLSKRRAVVRIDPAVALVMAVGAAAAARGAGRSVYEERGVRII
jgi:phage terminase large subunit-like protein